MEDVNKTQAQMLNQIQVQQKIVQIIRAKTLQPTVLQMQKIARIQKAMQEILLIQAKIVQAKIVLILHKIVQVLPVQTNVVERVHPTNLVHF